MNKSISLSPIINKNILHKANSMYNMFPNFNNKNILNSSQTLNNNSRNKLLLIKNKKYLSHSYINNINNLNSLSGSKNLNLNNSNDFNSSKNITNYSLSKNNSNFFKSLYNDSFYITKMPKNGANFSKFFYKSQSKLITSQRIFKHYIKEEERDEVVPIKYFKRGGAPKSYKELKELYKTNNVKFNKRIKELKANNAIAFKEDFNILDYQSTLIKLLSNRISEKNLHELQKNFVVFNEKNFGMVGPKGRFTNMAEKIKYNIPLYLYKKIKQLDIDKLVSRYNYYKKINENIKKKFKKKYEKKKKKKGKSDDISKGDESKEINNSY